MDNRLNKKYIVQDLIKKVPTNTCITNSNSSFQNIFFVKKRIGTKSKYGHVYLVDNKKKNNNKIDLALKIIDVDNLNKHELIYGQDIELYILNTMLSSKTLNRHFLMIYGIYNCNIDKHKDVWIHGQRSISSYTEDTLTTVHEQDHVLILSELASGDLKSIIKNKKMVDNQELMTNITLQCIMCIYLFHKMGFRHNDSHYGNFLYHKYAVSKSDPCCICYIHKRKRYYLPDMGITMNIWDFGLSKKIISKQHQINSMKDYIRILRILYSELPYNYTIWYNRIPNLLMAITTKNEQLLSKENMFISIIMNNMFSTKPIGRIIDTVKL